MPSDAVKFTLRTEPELLKKFRFVAEYNARSANRELEVLMKKHIADFEKATVRVLSSKLNTASSVTLKQVFYSA